MAGMSFSDPHNKSLPTARQSTAPPDDPNRGGVNLRPGHGAGDDDWAEPTPVTLPDGTRVALLKDGQALKHAYDSIKQATRRVCLEFYIWDDDETGRAFADLLREKAKAGVKVFVVYDSFGTFRHDRSLFDRMRVDNIKLAEFHPVRPWECTRSWKPFNRDHRKLVLVDEDVAGLGGMNIANAYAGSWVVENDLPPSKLWRDTGIGLRGPSARPFIKAFERTWHYCQHGGRIRQTEFIGSIRPPRPLKGNRVGKPSTVADPARLPSPQHLLTAPVGVMATAPSLSSPLRPIYASLIENARQSLRMTMAYFAPDDALVEQLCTAARRGVRVELMFGGKSDLPIMVTAARAFYTRLLDAGVRIFERQFVVLHAKTLVIDSRYSMIGSTNLDYRSIDFNLEISSIIDHPPLARQMDDLFEHDQQFAIEIDDDQWKRRKWIDRGVQWLVNGIRYVL